ncbi:MAG: aminoacyl-tRNA hydrolase, partial [Patescibacteria group bacterium]
MTIIIGLGNPTKKHEGDRHNAGFMALDAVAQKHEISFEDKSTFDAMMANDDSLLLVKPQTYMNDSGISAQKLFKQYKEMPVVVYDEVDINLGEVKCSFGRGAGGHNGVQSVIDHL